MAFNTLDVNVPLLPSGFTQIEKRAVQSLLNDPSFVNEIRTYWGLSANAMLVLQGTPRYAETLYFAALIAYHSQRLNALVSTFP